MTQQYASFEDLFYASYSGLQTLAFALQKGIAKYDRGCYAFRESVIKKYKRGEFAVSDLYGNVVRAMTDTHNACWYCGRPIAECGALTADHVLPRIKGGENDGENLMLVCRICNSSKGAKDLLVWYRERGEFPPMRVLAHYLKLVYKYAIALDLMSKTLDELDAMELPFDPGALPLTYPQPCEAQNCVPMKWLCGMFGLSRPKPITRTAAMSFQNRGA